MKFIYLIIGTLSMLAAHGTASYTDPIVSVLGFGNRWRDLPAVTEAPKPLPPYKPTVKDVEYLQECFYHRVWERVDDAELSRFQSFCKRLSLNKPDEFESNLGRNMFAAFRQVWHDISRNPGETNSAVLYKHYRPTKAEKHEIDNCFHSRSWEHKASNLTAHDDFCRRIATNRPNGQDSLEMNSFKAYRKIWLNICSKVTRKDYNEIVKCSDASSKSKSCKPEYYESIIHPQTWRDFRRLEVHQCMRANVGYKSWQDHCLGIIFQSYGDKYCQTRRS